MKRCPQCAAPLRRNDRFCSACGYSLESADSPVSDDALPAPVIVEDDDVRVFPPSKEEDDDVRVFTPSKEEDVRVYVPSKKKTGFASESEPSSSPKQNDTSEPRDPEDEDMKIAGSEKPHSDDTHIWTAEEIRELREKIDAEKQLQEEASKAKKNRVRTMLRSHLPILIIFCVLLFSCAALVIASLITGGNNYVSRSQLLTLIHDGSDQLSLYKNGKYYVTANSANVPISQSAINASGTVISALISEEDNSGSLYYSNGKTLTDVSDNVISLQMAYQSGSVVFLTEGDDFRSLYLYTGSNQKLIADHVTDSYCISPDGETVGYSVQMDSGTVVGYLYTKGSTISLGENNVPYAVADDAKILYLLKTSEYETALHVQKGPDTTESRKLTVSPSRVFFNSTLSEIVFTEQDVTYLSADGGEKNVIAEMGDASMLLPYGCPYMELSRAPFSATIYGLKSFKNSFIHCSNSIFYISKRMKSTRVVSDFDQIYLADNGKTLLYLKSGKIRSFNGTQPDAVHDLLVENVYSFAITADGEAIYYISGDYTLIYLKLGASPVILAETPDVSNLYGKYIFKGDQLVYVIGKDAYIAKGEQIKVAAFDLDYISSVAANRYYIYINGSRDGESVYFMSGDGKTFSEG